MTIRIEVALEEPEPRQRDDELADVVDRHCPELDMLSVPADVTRTLSLPEPVRCDPGHAPGMAARER